MLWCLLQMKFRKLCKSAVFCGLQGGGRSPPPKKAKQKKQVRLGALARTRACSRERVRASKDVLVQETFSLAISQECVDDTKETKGRGGWESVFIIPFATPFLDLVLCLLLSHHHHHRNKRSFRTTHSTLHTPHFTLDT